MGPEEATDVVKALAAFGAPSIRYHSFGQGQVKPSNVVLPRPGPASEAAAPLSPDRPPMPAPLSMAAPPLAAPPLAAPMPPVPAFRRTLGPSAPRPLQPAELPPAPTTTLTSMPPPLAADAAWLVSKGTHPTGQDPAAPEAAARPPAPPSAQGRGLGGRPLPEIFAFLASEAVPVGPNSRP